MADAVASAARRNNRRTAGVVAILIAIFVVLSISAEWHKSITTDELVYTVAGYVDLHANDFRLNAEHPPLWKMWAALPTLSSSLEVDYAGRQWQLLLQEEEQMWPFSVNTAFRTAGNDAERLIWRCRPMMIGVGAMLAVLIARWASRLAGGTAAIVATALFCFDPSFVAHSSLVTNDVPVTFAFALAAYAIWRLGNRFTLWRVLLLGIACGLCLNTKLSGILIVPLVIGLMLLRSLLPGRWPGLSKDAAGRGPKIAAAIGATLCVAAISYSITWAAYGFRFSAVPDVNQSLDFDWVIYNFAGDQLQMSHPDRAPTEAELAHWQRPASIRAIVSLRDHHVLPEGWLFGVLYSLKNTQLHVSFLLGQIRKTGWWYYFPLVILFKTPTATLVVFAICLIVSVRSLATRDIWRRRGWTAACLVLPILLYLAVAMRTPMDIGIRYILPVYPLIYVSVGVVSAHAWRRRPQLVSVLGAVFGVALLAEVVVAFPKLSRVFQHTVRRVARRHSTARRLEPRLGPGTFHAPRLAAYSPFGRLVPVLFRQRRSGVLRHPIHPAPGRLCVRSRAAAVADAPLHRGDQRDLPAGPIPHAGVAEPIRVNARTFATQGRAGRVDLFV